MAQRQACPLHGKQEASLALCTIRAKQVNPAVGQDAPHQQTVFCAEFSGEETEGSVMKLEVPDLARDAAHICSRLQDEQASTAASCRQPSPNEQPLADISNRSEPVVSAIGEPSHPSSLLLHKRLAPPASLEEFVMPQG